jgi:hypothetical protein
MQAMRPGRVRERALSRVIPVPGWHWIDEIRDHPVQLIRADLLEAFVDGFGPKAGGGMAPVTQELLKPLRKRYQAQLKGGKTTASKRQGLEGLERYYAEQVVSWQDGEQAERGREDRASVQDIVARLCPHGSGSAKDRRRSETRLRSSLSITKADYVRWALPDPVGQPHAFRNGTASFVGAE